jgi:hypothetical protein
LDGWGGDLGAAFVVGGACLFVDGAFEEIECDGVLVPFFQWVPFPTAFAAHDLDRPLD